nr:3,4-dihydroxy-2-butanone-4-phosphate synthase [uncultured Lichenicoccus sp.]
MPAPELTAATPVALAEAIGALRDGRMVIMVDDEDRENEGDLVLAAEHATPEAVNFLVTHGRGLVCLALEADQLDRLGLPLMVRNNTAPRGTAFTVSIEARVGVDTGISAHDRARTIQVAAAADARAEDLVSPGHVFPLRAVPGGVLARAGHTEGSIDILRLAGLKPSAVICEVMSADGTMARLPELREFGARHGLPIVSIAELVRTRLAMAATHTASDLFTPVPDRLDPVGSAQLPSAFGHEGAFTVHAFRDPRDGIEHLALVSGDLSACDAPLVRLHSECLTGDALGSLRCDCGGQLRKALQLISESPGGVLVYLRGHEGRGIGLANKIRAYSLQDQGLDTVEANHQLGFATDERDWGIAARILHHLGVERLDLLTNNPDKIRAVRANGIEVMRRIPLEIPPNPYNRAYLEAKAIRMGHDLHPASAAAAQ